jgi:hypothetical protein
MTRHVRLTLACSLLALTAAASARAADDPRATLKAGNPGLTSAGPLTFGPDGILFVGDPRGANVFAFDTGDGTALKAKAPINVKNIVAKVAALLHADPHALAIVDLAVNPASGKAYLAITHTRGKQARPVLVRVGPDGSVAEVSVTTLRFAKAAIPGAPAPGSVDRGQDKRSQSVTDLAYVDGRLFIAGLSNEEAGARLMVMAFPFKGPVDAAAIEIYHGAHGRTEAKSPVRTFVVSKIGNEPTLLAAFTGTPLVKVPVAALEPGAHVKGTTIAELGSRNVPLDMITYQKGGKSFLLVANSQRGVLKIATEGVGSAPAITTHVVGTKGPGIETVEKLKNVVQLDRLDDTHALILTLDDTGALNLETVDLP